MDLTLLNEMAGPDVKEQFDRHVAWGLRRLDLKGKLLGQKVEHLTPEQARQVRRAADARGLAVDALSTNLMDVDVEAGEAAARQQHVVLLDPVIELARILEPRRVRLIAARSSARPAGTHAVEYLQSRHPWVLPLYQEMVDRLADAGFPVTLENEIGPTLLSSPQEMVDVLAAIDRPGACRLTWDIVNLWQVTGALPSLEAYHTLRPWLGLVHVKGGRRGDDDTLQWAATLADSDWPVRPILGQLIADAATDGICLNPPHGDRAHYAGGLPAVEADLQFLRQLLADHAA